MQYILKNLITLIGVSLLGIGIVSASPSSDCGDEDVKPITIHSSAKLVNKDS